VKVNASHASAVLFMIDPPQLWFLDVSRWSADVTAQSMALLAKPLNIAAGDLSNPVFDRLRRSILRMLSCRFVHRPHYGLPLSRERRSRLLHVCRGCTAPLVGCSGLLCRFFTEA
jgi:hypothetical protein